MMLPKKKWTGQGQGLYSVPKLVDLLDRAFSELVRLRHANPRGIVQCYTCSALHHWKQLEAGHYVDRDRKATRWDKRNVKPQCPDCNRFADGRREVFARHIDREHGTGTADTLEAIAQARRGDKLVRSNLIVRLEVVRLELRSERARVRAGGGYERL